MSAQINKIALFIDGLNLYTTARSVGFEIDFKRLLREFQSRGYLLRAFYYTAVIEDQEYSSIRPLIDWLDYNGYTVVTKATKEFVDQTGRRKVKGNMDIELAVDAIELAPHIDQMVLFSGDGDFCCLVKAMQRRGVRVVVVSANSTQPPLVAQELRRFLRLLADGRPGFGCAYRRTFGCAYYTEFSAGSTRQLGLANSLSASGLIIGPGRTFYAPLTPAGNRRVP